MARLVEHVRAGCYFETAARAAGISPATAYTWRRRGERGEEPFSEFLSALEQAEAEAEIDAIGCIRRAWEDGDWRAAATFLARRHPKRWAERSRVRDWQAEKPPPEAATAFLLDPECQALSRALVERAAEVREAELGDRD